MMVWNKRYASELQVWGNEPSELALFAFNILQHDSRYQGNIDILDLGCGYGRDAVYLANNLDCHILGIDVSKEAIKLAKEFCPRELSNRIEFLCYDFSAIIDKFDMIFVSNLYYLLKPYERKKLWETVKRCLKKDGWLFLNTLSVRDPQQFGRGTPVETEANSFMDKKYYHFSTRTEIEKDFEFVNIRALFEREYNENHTTGEAHRHISWILLGNQK